MLRDKASVLTSMQNSMKSPSLTLHPPFTHAFPIIFLTISPIFFYSAPKNSPHLKPPLHHPQPTMKPPCQKEQILSHTEKMIVNLSVTNHEPTIKPLLHNHEPNVKPWWRIGERLSNSMWNNHHTMRQRDIKTEALSLIIIWITLL